MLSALWRYRYFVMASIVGELRGRFARSRLGLLWSILHPLAQAAIFALVLAEVLGAKLGGIDDKAAYPMYLLAGMAAWTLFSEIVSRSMTVFIEYSATLKKIAFPRICLPVIVWGSALVNHALLLVAIAVVFLFLGKVPGVAWLALPLGILLISVFAFGLGMLLGVFNVFVRDIGQAVGVVLQLWFWLTPIVYPVSVVPDHLRWVINLNPMVPLVEIYHEAMVFDRWPDFAPLIVPVILSVVLLVLSFMVFKRASPELVDAL
ncbi:ABC transporter permease [Chelativorans sp. M5D2P16]|uniref:ABC transporter permease n=1 Tax=Chelativorans sp. M5D2P16 TaxID=3095678 RepID=UPI002ACA6C5C|nr:ABC transporter permease [Chelativorans sp. M5D2P16]MDZ5699959.1 ABC transporter permease [Chelativorans sp. M5D2P16]